MNMNRKRAISGFLSVAMFTASIFAALPAPAAFADEVLFYHGDQINSSNVITDASGNRAALYEYDPFGSTVTHTGAASVKHRFTGQEADDSTGLYYYNARYYDPQLGRFTIADWIVPDPNNPQDLNRYTYANNNPVRYTDPTGHKKKKFWGFFGAIIGAVVGSIIPGVGTAIGGMIGGAIGGGLQAGLNTGKFSSIVTGAISGGVQGYGIGNAIGGVFQGVSDWATGAGSKILLPGGGIGSPQDIANYNGNILTNGILTSEKDAQGLANQFGMPVFYNPSHGLIADLTESTLQKLTGTSALGRQFGNVLMQSHTAVHIFAHSQGGLTTANALLSIKLAGNKLASGSLVDFVGSAQGPISSGVLAKAVGASLNRFSTNVFDPINLVQPSLNPVKLIGGAVGGPLTLAKQHSLQKAYAMEIKTG